MDLNSIFLIMSKTNFVTFYNVASESYPLRLGAFSACSRFIISGWRCFGPHCVIQWNRATIRFSVASSSGRTASIFLDLLQAKCAQDAYARIWRQCFTPAGPRPTLVWTLFWLSPQLEN